MVAIARRIVGPQEQFERTGAQSLRDIRPLTTRLSEELRGSASGLVLGMTAAATFFEPAVIDITVPAAALYALWVLTRRPRLPIRLPRTADCLDHSSPRPGSRKAKRAAGDIFIGWNEKGQELWITGEDARQHITLPGTTGAGKTTAILSLLVNALAQGSGFVLVDGKANRELFGKVLALARRFGREDDVRVLNFMVASGLKDSHSFNPFATGNADAIRELLASQLGEARPDDSNGVFRDRAVALIGTIVPVLVWLRDHKGMPLNIDVIRFSIELRWIWRMAMERVCRLRNTATGDETDVDVSADMPEEILWPMKAYLGELPGYDASVPLDKQKGEEPSKQHGFAQMYFSAMFQQLGVSLGHIFKVESGDIDIRDVVLNRRILVVNLPALENSDSTLAGLGKLVVASLRGMMAQLLGASLEGDYTEADQPGMGPSPFPVVLDEMAYYATSGLDRMLAMGRGINICFMLGFQEVSGIWARIGEKTASLLGNANFTIAMRQQDSGRTKEWLEKTAGQTNVTQATSYQGSADGAYREARHAEVRTVSRVDWNDLTSLLEGEAIILFGGRRIYGRVFHAKINDVGPKRLGRTVMLSQPDPQAARKRLDDVAAIAKVIEDGALLVGQAEPDSPVLNAIRDGYIAATKAGGRNASEWARVALQAVDGLPDSALTARPARPSDGTPVTALGPMLSGAVDTRHGGDGSGGEPNEPVDALELRDISQIEEIAGATAMEARKAALSIVAERDRALAALPRVEPPTMTREVFLAKLAALIEAVRKAGGNELRRAA